MSYERIRLNRKKTHFTIPWRNVQHAGYFLLKLNELSYDPERFVDKHENETFTQAHTALYVVLENNLMGDKVMQPLLEFILIGYARRSLELD